MCNHDFQVGDKVWTVADPHFQKDVIKILEGVVESKWSSPRGDEFAYDIRHANGIVYRNIFGINVYGSLEDLHDAVTHDLENAVEDAYKEIHRCSERLAKAECDKERLLQMLLEWRQEVRGTVTDAQSTKEIDKDVQ